ncbi:MAG: methyltransferase domain-containing protein [Verrucomicrobia bacterium]|nr:methyltransferase domain-containing protein [Verrucomicrobiota bacterium]
MTSDEQQRIERIARCYPSRWLQGYARGKLRSDPVYRAAVELLEKSDLPILDIGCGMGLFAFYLRELGIDTPVIGVDLDERKIESARKVAAGRYANVQFLVQDGGTPVEFCGNVVIFDVLHYLSEEAQRALLRQVTEQIPINGVCIIRTTPRDSSWRFKLTVFEEFLLHAFRWMKAPTLCFPTAESVTTIFAELGFVTEVKPLWGKTPFNSYLFVARRKT